jgi:hypothetical protein
MQYVFTKEKLIDKKVHDAVSQYINQIPPPPPPQAKPQIQQTMVNNMECEKIRKTCCELNDSKVKLAILGMRLWIVTAVVVFLVGSGGSIMCYARSSGRTEEKVDNTAAKIEKIENQIEGLRQEIWQVIPIGKYRDNVDNTGGGGIDANNGTSTTNVLAGHETNVARYRIQSIY